MRVLAILIVIGGLIAGWFLLKEKRIEQRDHSWAAQLAPHLTERPLGDPTAEHPWQADEAGFFRMLYFLNKADGEGLDLGLMISNACRQTGMAESKADLVRSSLLANYETAKKFRIFEDPTNVLKLEQGEPALIKLAGWVDEPVAAGRIVPPTLAPEVANSLANLQIMPAVVRDARSGEISPATLERARAFERAKIITRTTLDEVGRAVRKGGA